MENQSSPYDVVVWIAAALLLMLGVGFVYSAYQVPINTVILSFCRIQLRLLAWLPGTRVAEYLAMMDARPLPELAAKLDFRGVMTVVRYVGRFVGVPMAGALLFMTRQSWSKMGLSHTFVREFDMKKLMQYNAMGSFPHMAPVAWRELDREPLDEGPWRMARQPLQWAVENHLILGPDNKPLPEKLFLDKRHLANIKSELLKPNKNRGVHLDRAAALKLFESHLGPAFTGVAALPEYQRGLAAVFMAFGHGDKTTAYALLNQMSLSFVEKGRSKIDPAKPDPAQEMELDITGADEVLAKYADSEALADNTHLHANFLHTWFHSLLEFARNKGVLEGSRFIWLRPTDRPLWYVLNQAGRDVPHTETAGEWAHYLAEEELGQAIEEPEVEEAFNALEEALIGDGWLPAGGA